MKNDHPNLRMFYNHNKFFFQVSGKYYVQLPDGRVQVVTYTVDGASGYVAHVSYIRPSSKAQAPVLSYTDSPAIELLWY